MKMTPSSSLEEAKKRWATSSLRWSFSKVMTGMALAPQAGAAGGKSPVVNAAEHAWVVGDARFPIDPALAV
ncbi:MAG: hypothetical protein J0M17_22205, partial [Planctomycetes bacterium]|nr:hypothetical protein [Planctomycetota bacterium]